MTIFPQTTTKKITQVTIISVKHQFQQRRRHRQKKKKKKHRRCARRKQAKSYAIRPFPKRAASRHRQQLTKKKNHPQRNQLLKNVNGSPRAARLNDFKCKARRRLALSKNHRQLRHLRHRRRISSQHRQKSQKNINNHFNKNRYRPHNQWWWWWTCHPRHLHRWIHHRVKKMF